MIFITDFIIKYPTRINAGAVAADGISRKTGEKSRAKRNSTETTIEERPVRAPATIPEVDSAKLVTVEVPRQAPVTVPIESARRASFAFVIFPSLLKRFAWFAIPNKVPRVSKRK